MQLVTPFWSLLGVNDTINHPALQSNHIFVTKPPIYTLLYWLYFRHQLQRPSASWWARRLVQTGCPGVLIRPYVHSIRNRNPGCHRLPKIVLQLNMLSLLLPRSRRRRVTCIRLRVRFCILITNGYSMKLSQIFPRYIWKVLSDAASISHFWIAYAGFDPLQKTNFHVASMELR